MTTAELTFSLIVSTTNRADTLHTLLRALEQQSYPHFEVVVVVGPTSDHTFDVLAKYERRVRIVRCPRRHLGQARNVGLGAACGDVVAFIDDDAVPARNWLAQLAVLFADPGLDGSGGIVYLVHPNDPIIQHRIGISSALAEQYDVRRAWLDRLAPEGLSHLWIGRMMGTNMAYRRRAVLEVGGFDEFYEWVYDETDLAMRLVRAGHVIQPVLEAPVYHVPASSHMRVAYSYLGKWWIQTKAAIYFSLKNGRTAGESWRTLVTRCLQLVHGHWLWTGQLWREGRITFRQMAYMRSQELKSAVHGAAAGLWGARRLLPAQTVADMLNNPEPIRPFQTATSTQQPAVDPISNRSPSISMPEEPLRIGLLSYNYPPRQYEGVGRHTNLLARGLFELGHTVHVVTFGDREQVTFYDGAYVHRIPYKLERYGRYRALTKLFHALNYSHAVHDKVKRLIFNDGVQVADSPVWQFDGLVTAQAGLLPVVVRAQTALRQVAMLQNNRDDDARLVGELEQTLVEWASHLVPNSLATVEALRKVYSVDPAHGRYTVVPHGIVPVDEAAAQPFDLENPPNTLTVLYLGRLEKRKGVLDLFAAMPTVVERVPNVRFVFAGADNSRSDGFLLRTGLDYPGYFARTYPQLANRVTFLGQVSEEKLHELYRTCDLFVAPSLYESFGLIYLEAMNYAKPVIGCKAGGVPEVVDDGVSGLLVEPGAPPALAEAIASLLRSPHRLHAMGLAGRQRLLNRFTHVHMARGFEQVYRQVVGRGPSPVESGDAGILPVVGALNGEGEACKGN